jgi:N-acetylglucosamine kinase-like BadF-type ATPase
VKALFLGVDGGQSSTIALIGDENGNVIGSGRGGPCNHVKSGDGREKFLRAIGECLSAACREAGLDVESVEFESACLGFSGGPQDKEPILKEMLRARRMMVSTDAPIALAGATGGEPGVITIAGTGSISWGRNGEGRAARAGGWGYLFGDEGGAFDIVRQALRAALRQEEGWGPPTALHARLLEAAGAGSANDLLHLCYTADWPRSRIARLSKVVDETAEAGDPVARQILERAAQNLAEITAAVRNQLFQEGETVRVAYIGGVFKSRLVRERFTRLVELTEGNAVSAPLYPPAAGALIEAYAAAGMRPNLFGVPDLK